MPGGMCTAINEPHALRASGSSDLRQHVRVCQTVQHGFFTSDCYCSLNEVQKRYIAHTNIKKPSHSHGRFAGCVSPRSLEASYYDLPSPGKLRSKLAAGGTSLLILYHGDPDCVRACIWLWIHVCIAAGCASPRIIRLSSSASSLGACVVNILAVMAPHMGWSCR